MTNIPDDHAAYMSQLTNVKWSDQGDTLSVVSDSKEKIQKITSQLQKAGIIPNVVTTKTKQLELRTIMVTRDQIQNANRGQAAEKVEVPAIPSPKAVEPKYVEKFAKLESRNKKFTKAEIEFSVPNRYNDEACRCVKATMLTYHTKVEGEDEDGIRFSEEMDIGYGVHANNVKLEGTDVHVICSQAPKSTNEEEFWNAAMENTHMILDLTNAADRVKGGAQRYFPAQVGEEFKAKQGLSVTCTNETKAVAGEKRLKMHEYLVSNGREGDNKKETSVSRLHYRGWPDRGAVTDKELAKIINYVRSQPDALGGQPLWIHCKAGVGRTGTVTVALGIADLFSKGKLTRDNYEQVIDDLIQSGRSQRNNYFVQTAEQYQLLHEFAQGLLDGSIVLSK